MTSYLPEDIDKALTKIPDELRDAVFTPQTSEKVLTIGKRYGLNVEQTGILLTNVRLAMIGILTPIEFQAEITTSLNLAPTTATNIATDISVEIVQDALNMLKKHQETKHFTDEELTAMLLEEDEEINQEESQYLASTGIEIIDQSTTSANTSTKAIGSTSAVDEIQRGIIGEKLSGNFKIPGEHKDYSVNKSTEPATTALKIIRHRDRVDPYREPLE